MELPVHKTFHWFAQAGSPVEGRSRRLASKSPVHGAAGKGPPFGPGLAGNEGFDNIIRTEGGVLRPSGAVDDTRLRCQSALCKWGGPSDRELGYQEAAFERGAAR